MASGNHLYTAGISLPYQSTHYLSGDKRPRNLFEVDNGNRSGVPTSKRQRRVEEPMNNGHEVFPAVDRRSLQGVFGGDNSSRVVELDDEDLMGNTDQQQIAQYHQQPPGLRSSALGYNAAPSVDRNLDNHNSHNAHALSNPIYGMENSYVQQPSIYYSGHTNANLGAGPNQVQQQLPPFNTASVTPGYGYSGTNTYYPAQDVDAGMGSRSNVDTASVNPSQLPRQEDYHNWQRPAQDTDFPEYSQGVTGHQHEPLEGSTGLSQSGQHESAHFYDDADFDDESLDFPQPSSLQHGSHYRPIEVHAYVDEPRYTNQPSFREYGSRDQPIELDGPEEELDKDLDFAADPPVLGSHQPTRVNSKIGATRRGTFPGTSNIGISASNASRPSLQQSLQSGGASGGPGHSQQVQPTAPTRRSDAELAKHSSEKKQNKAEEIAFEKHGRWWHKLSVHVEAVPAIHHYEIANQLRTTANNRGSYQFAAEKGASEKDRLAFVPTHMNWAGTRANRPNELFTFYKPNHTLAACEPQRWMYHGRRVLDHKGKWMWYYDDVPVTIPSVVEGWRMEAYMRRNPSLVLADIQGRMPRVFKTTIKGKDIEDHGPWDDTTLRNRMMRFRWHACLISWTRYEKCDVTKKYFEGFLERADNANNTVFPGFRVRNSTRNLGRDLTTRETEELKRMRKAAKEQKSAAASAETSGQDGDEGTPSVADWDAPRIHQSGIRPMSLLTSEMPVPPTAATAIDHVEDYGDPNVGNYVDDHDQQKYTDGSGHGFEASTIPTWPGMDPTTVSGQSESTHQSPNHSSWIRQFRSRLQGLSSGVGLSSVDNQNSTLVRPIAQQSRPTDYLPSQQSEPSPTNASSGTNMSNLKRPFDDLYDVSPESSPRKKSRTTESAHSEPSLGSAPQDVQTSNAQIGPDRVILKPSAPSSARQNTSPAGHNDPQIYQTSPVNGQKRGLGSTEGPGDTISEGRSQKRPANGQMLPPLVSASGVVVGKPDTQRHPERRSFSTKVKSPLRKKQSSRATKKSSQTEQTAVFSETTKKAEGSKPTLLQSPVISERRKTSSQDGNVVSNTINTHSSSASNSQQLEGAEPGDRDRQSADATARSPRTADNTGPGIATAGAGLPRTRAASDNYTSQLHLQNGASLRPDAEMDYTHLEKTLSRKASPKPTEPAVDHIATELDFPPFDIVVTEAGTCEYNRISALIEEIEIAERLAATDSSQAENNKEQEPLDFTFPDLEPVNVDFRPQGYQTPDPPEVSPPNCEACSNPTDGWMVQCSNTSHDDNEGWYHFHCARLTEEDCEELEDWFCPVCRPRAEITPIPGRPSVGGKGLGPVPAVAPKRQPSPRASTTDRVTKNKAPASPRKPTASRRRALDRELADLPDYWSREEDFARGTERGPTQRRAAAGASSSRTGDDDSRFVRRSTRRR